MQKNQRDQQSRQTAIYSRKSKFTGKGESIENQIELCKRYVETIHGNRDFRENGNFLSDDVREGHLSSHRGFRIYEDEGFSGGDLERPEFKRMMEDARAGKISRIIVYRLDRISRNIGDFAGLIEELNRLNVEFVSIKEQFDTSSPMGRAMMYIASVFSQLERETIAERIRDNMLELAKTGRWLGGTTPTGYASESISTVMVDGRTKKCCKLKQIPEEAEVVRRIFAQYLQCRSLKKTAEILNNEGIRTKGGNRFTSVAIRAILSNPVYAAADEAARRYFLNQEIPVFFGEHEVVADDREEGEENTKQQYHGMLAYNRTLQRPGKSNQIRRMREWIVAVGKHEPIISGKDWVKAQNILQKNGRKCELKKTNLYE